MTSDDPISIFRADFSDQALLSLVKAITTTSVASAKATRARYSPDFVSLANIIGQDRYHDIQQAMARLKLPGVTPCAERHPRGTTKFIALESANVRATLVKLDSRHEAPEPTLFRVTEHAKQLAFKGLGGKLIAEITIVLADAKTGNVRFIDVRFPEGTEGGYFEDSLDLLTIKLAALPVENIRDARVTREKARKIHAPRPFAPKVIAAPTEGV